MHMQTLTPLAAVFGPPIHIYTRAQAIADGVLVDVTEEAQRFGFGVPVAVTRAVWTDAADHIQLRHVVCMACQAARQNPTSERVAFQVHQVYQQGSPALLEMCISPGDHGEPVITIMYPDED